MNKIALMLLMLPFVINANDTIQMVLESNGVSTEEFPVVGESVTFSGEELMNRAYQMHKKEILMAYATVDHESDASHHLNALIVKMSTSDTPVHTGVTIVPHLIFDDNRINGAYRPIAPNDNSTHALQHKDDIIKVKKIAIDQCNSSLSLSQVQVPVFTAPQNLVDILLHVNRANLSYTLHEGSTFHCIAARQAR